jgi:hypothetical protein
MGDNFFVGEQEDDILHGDQELIIFDCGVGIDIIIDFSLEEVDGNAGICELRYLSDEA